MGVTPAFAQVADIRVFPLMNPHMLQLGTIGSQASVNYGANIRMEAPGISCNTYVDIVNFDRYDMIIGTDRKSTRLNSSHLPTSRMPSSA